LLKAISLKLKEKLTFSSVGLHANVTEVRIDGCQKEPCTLKKGVTVPVELDFSFEAPTSAQNIYFKIFAHDWNAPGAGAYGTEIAEGSNCTDFQIQSCPPLPGENYTLKSKIYVDPSLESTLELGKTVWQHPNKLL